MQEVSGLDAAHKDDRTYGRENPLQDLEGSSIVAAWAQFSLQEPFAPSEAQWKRYSGFLENNGAVQDRKMRKRRMERFSCCSHSLFQTRPPVEDRSVPSWKNPAKPDLFG